MIATSATRPLPPTVADRLMRVCGLLGSDHAGEAANAASAATKLLRDHGWTWAEVVQSGVVAPPPLQPQRRPAPRHEPVDWRGAAAACLARGDLLTEWERGFVASLMGFRQPSAKQRVILARLVERVSAATEGAP